ncbi:hypothetical protein GWP57_13550 [Gammaproteobacteria bacterium]|jgi:hypothetical protein|nr:hypothetical protein [Gammaproteobacteria bacterium]
MPIDIGNVLRRHRVAEEQQPVAADNASRLLKRFSNIRNRSYVSRLVG